MYIDENVIVILVLALVGLLVYYIAKYTRRGRTTTSNFKRKEHAWLKNEKKAVMKLITWVLIPATLFWIFMDVAFVAIANYYFQNVIFGPILGFTPMQTLIATIMLLFLIYLVYKTYIKRGDRK